MPRGRANRSHFTVNSFTTPGVKYQVDWTQGTCTCDDTFVFCKHKMMIIVSGKNKYINLPASVKQSNSIITNQSFFEGRDVTQDNIVDSLPSQIDQIQNDPPAPKISNSNRIKTVQRYLKEYAQKLTNYAALIPHSEIPDKNVGLLEAGLKKNT